MLFIINVKKTGRTLSSMLLFFFFLGQPLFSQDISWFSNTPPEGEKKIVTSGMHRLSSKRGKRGKSSIIQWLRKGNNPEKADYVQIAEGDDFEFYLYSPSQKLMDGKLSTKGTNTSFMYASEEEGYYNAYFIKREVVGNILHVHVAKSELLNHSCRNGHKLIRGLVGPHEYPETIPVEIVRKRELTEDLHYFAASGDKVDYEFIIDGKGVEGADLTLVSQKDWSKTQQTNNKGISTFQFIQDYFSSWQELNNRKIYTYLIYGEITLEEQGIYKGKAYSQILYTTSLSDGYRPAKTMYMSIFWAFMVFILTLVVSVAGIFVYRLRRQKIYKEIKFDEKN